MLSVVGPGNRQRGNCEASDGHFVSRMTISVTELKARLLEIVREVERQGTVVEVERHGQVVARIVPASTAEASVRPWERLRGTGSLLASPEESVLDETDFEASR